MATVNGVRFEHYLSSHAIGVHETRPRLSWRIENATGTFTQYSYEVELTYNVDQQHPGTMAVAVVSPMSILVPWPFKEDLSSRQKITIRIRVQDAEGSKTPWSESESLETGLLRRVDWHCERIAAPWATQTNGPDSEWLFRKAFRTARTVQRARLYITAQGVYEAEINGGRVGDYFLAPGWTAYDGRLQYQTYDITSMLVSGTLNCIGVRVAEGWFCGRLGWEGGHRNIWGPHPALMAQLEITYVDGSAENIISGSSWKVARGPIRLAELYDGEKYDATLEIAKWSSNGAVENEDWHDVMTLPPLPNTISLVAGTSGPVRRLQTVEPKEIVKSPAGNTIIDFGQNLVGYVRLKRISGERGHKITLKHSEILEHGELCTRTLRVCSAVDEYTLCGDGFEESYEPRFTFHGFRYVQIDGWCGDLQRSSTEAVVCHTEMKKAGTFHCSDPLINQLYSNICWGMRGNFLSVPTDCPQRDERLGWSGDLALFAPTAVLLYDCFAMLSNWLVDVEHDQTVLGGVPPMVSPNSTIADPKWCRRIPCAIWHDVTILAPWALYEETGDVAILAQQYQSMLTWMSVLPRNKTGATHLWDESVFQLGVCI